MIAKFIGADGSLGLKHGQEYKIRAISSQYPIMIYILVSPGNTIPCGYSSLEKFLENWTFQTN